MNIIRKPKLAGEHMLGFGRPQVQETPVPDYPDAEAAPAAIANVDSLDSPDAVHIDNELGTYMIKPSSEAHEKSLFTYEDYKNRYSEELEILKEDAMSEAKKLGYDAGRAQAMRELAGKIESLESLLGSVEQSIDQFIDSQQDLIVEIAFAAVGKMLGDKLASQSGVLACVEQVIKQTKSRQKVLLRVAPDDFASLNAQRNGLIEKNNAGAIEIIPDERIELGGCLLETPAGNLDGRLESQLQVLRETLLHVRQRRSENGPSA